VADSYPPSRTLQPPPFSEAIRLDPQNSEAYSNRGLLRAISPGSYPLAISDCNEAIRLNPVDAQAYLGRALARALQADFTGAVRDLTEVFLLDPEIGDVISQVQRVDRKITDGLIYGDVQAGVAYVGRAIARGFDNVEGVLADFNEAVRIHPLVGQILTQALAVRDQVVNQTNSHSSPSPIKPGDLDHCT
jgi:tetratricopeptide (TPR) repeat protein